MFGYMQIVSETFQGSHTYYTLYNKLFDTVKCFNFYNKILTSSCRYLFSKVHYKEVVLLSTIIFYFKLFIHFANNLLY